MRNFATRKVDTVILEMDISIAEQVLDILMLVQDNTRMATSPVFGGESLNALRVSMIEDAEVRYPSGLFKAEAHDGYVELRETTPAELSAVHDARVAARAAERA